MLFVSEDPSVPAIDISYREPTAVIVAKTRQLCDANRIASEKKAGRLLTQVEAIAVNLYVQQNVLDSLRREKAAVWQPFGGEL